ncbi:hypothetical protein C8J57DRAFT_554438 [Mycena rebaudengoi]|nr:hypothetical protein C8J57DRAFT_554438 [Mycena rebaudengoi]
MPIPLISITLPTSMGAAGVPRGFVHEPRERRHAPVSTAHTPYSGGSAQYSSGALGVSRVRRIRRWNGLVWCRWVREREPTQQQERERGRVSSTMTGYERERVYGGAGSRAGSPAQRQYATPTPAAPVNGSTAQYAPGSATTTYAAGTSSPRYMTPQYTTMGTTPRTLTARYEYLGRVRGRGWWGSRTSTTPSRRRPCRPRPHPQAPPCPNRAPPRRSRLRRRSRRVRRVRGRKWDTTPRGLHGAHRRVHDATTPPTLCSLARTDRWHTSRPRRTTGASRNAATAAALCGLGAVESGGGGGPAGPLACAARPHAARAHARPLAHAPSARPARASGADAAPRRVYERGPAGGERVCVCVLSVRDHRWVGYSAVLRSTRVLPRRSTVPPTPT